MSAPKRKREVQLNFRVSPEELALIEQKMAQLGTKNREAYLRKMALDGYVVRLELPELKEMVSLMRYSSNNLNQDVLCKGWINHLIHCDCGSFVVICSVIARKGEKYQQLSQKCYQEGNAGEPPCLQLHKLEAWGPFIFQNSFSDEPAFCR